MVWLFCKPFFVFLIKDSVIFFKKWNTFNITLNNRPVTEKAKVDDFTRQQVCESHLLCGGVFSVSD